MKIEGIPQSWELLAIRKPKAGEHFIGPNDKPDTVTEHTRQIIVI